jgi:hypothetical protein
VVDVAVGEEERGDAVALLGEPVGGALRGVDEEAGIAEVKAVRVKDSAREGVELHEEK